MKKRILSFFLAVLLLVVSLPATVVSAEEELQKKNLSVVWMGTEFWGTVFQKGEQIYVPLSWLTYFGLLMCQESEQEYMFYYSDQKEEKIFAKRIFIEKQNLNFSISYCFPKSSLLEDMRAFYTWIDELSINFKNEEDFQKFVSQELNDFLSGRIVKKADKLSYDKEDYTSIYEGIFSSYIEQDGELYLPLAELLPLMNAKVAVGNDGKLYLNPNMVSLSQALYNADIGSLCFVAEDDIVGDKFVSVGAYIVDSLTSGRIGRFDFIWNTGRV